MFTSVAQSCPTLCDPMNHRTSGLSITNSRSPPKLMSIESVMQSKHPQPSSSVVPFLSHLQSFPASGSFPMSQLFSSGGQSTGVSALASFLPKNTQSKGLSKVLVTITLCTRLQKRHRCIDQSYGLCGRGRGWEDLGE